MHGSQKTISKGSIQCLKCRSVGGFVCHHMGVRVQFVYVGLSHDEHAIYIPNITTAKWNSGSKPFKATCAQCDTSIPLWMLEMNRYVKNSHTS